MSRFASLQMIIVTGRRPTEWSREKYYMIINFRCEEMNRGYPVNEEIPTEFIIIFLCSSRRIFK